ncbi:hypothetical protein CCR75_009295 [Bremia lactucae]|uniref:E3 ubiquitin-protein ligase listerin n=1 Tax=Bremia lactucae TaxID=4779 RepID=A0A976IER4_BRELC|nr:hypothetical protein CCR75_009295 [Bremia lactucae]
MPPGKNKQREKLEQSRASSSSRAHQSLLASAGSNSALPFAFIGFANFAQSASNTVQATSKTNTLNTKPIIQSIYDGSDHEIALALKMLAKKGAVTKIKALQCFLTDVLPPRQPAEIRPMLGHFTQLYTFEMRDQNDRKIRQLLNEVLAALATKMRPRAFKPHLQRLLPYWLLAMHDSNVDVAAVANKAFRTLFVKEEMRKTVLEENVPGMMEEFHNFFTKTPDTFEGIPLQPDEKEERYERCISAAVLTVNALVEQFGEQEVPGQAKSQEARCSVATVVLSEQFRRLANSSTKHPNFTRDSVRKAIYVVFGTLCTRAKSIIAAQEESYGKLILGILGDKSPANYDAMWNAVLTFLQAFPGVWHSSISYSKFVTTAVYPRLFAQIRHGFYGSGRSSFPTLLPFVSLIPIRVALDPATGCSALYTGILEHCWKYIESKDSRFGESPPIAAYFECIFGYFSVFLTHANDTEFIEENAEVLQRNYVKQFESIFVSSLKTALSSLEFPNEKVSFFAKNLLTLSLRLRSVSMDSAVLNTLKDDFTERIHTWTRSAISLMVAEVSFVPSRVKILTRTCFDGAQKVFVEDQAAQWLTTSKELYQHCLDQVDKVVGDPVISLANNASTAKLLEAIYDVCSTHPLDLVIDKPSDVHYDNHYRPVLRMLYKWKQSFEVTNISATIRVALKLTQPFFLAAKEKKKFVLQLFQDCDVQFGDMAEASDIIQYGLRFPITEKGTMLWLSCGSWQRPYESGIVLGDQFEPELRTLETMWRGKLFDELLINCLKERLDDLDATAFITLVKACLGSLTDLPVVSSDAVAILCHFVISNNVDNTNAIVVQLLTQLCELFYKLRGKLPRELEAVEDQLYKQLFHLSARGSYRVEASALWARTVRFSLKTWSLARADKLVDDFAEVINTFLLTDSPQGTVLFNSKQFAAYIKSYVTLGADQRACSVSQLVAKLDAINLRCNEGCPKSLFYSRVLPGLSEVCEDKQVIDAFLAFFVSQASDNVEKAVDLIARLVDLDVIHALTSVVFHSDNQIQRGADVVEILERYLLMDNLYEALKLSSSIFDNALIAAIASCQSKHKREIEDIRNVVLVSKDQRASEMTQSVRLLTPEQHRRLDELSVTMLSSNSSVAARKRFIMKLNDDNGDWKAKSTQIVALSLFNAIDLEKKECDEAISAVNDFFALCGRDVTAKSKAEMFKYIQLVTLGAKKKIKLSGVCSITKLNIIDISTQPFIIQQLLELLGTSSPGVVEIDEWIDITRYVVALAEYLPGASSNLCEAWKSLVRMVVTHAIAGKAETAKVAALKIHKRWSNFGDRRICKGDEERIVLGYPNKLATARQAFMDLVSAVYASSVDVFQELAVHYREAILSAVLCTLSESAEMKASIATTYVAITSPFQCFQLVSLWFSVENVLATVHSALRSTLSSLHDVAHVKRLVLESFGGIETLASLFNGNRYPLQPVVRVLLYILVSYSGAFQVCNYDASVIDVNAEDEAATESALAKVLIPKAMRSALRAVYTDKIGESSVRNIHIRSCKQGLPDIVGKLLLWDLFLQFFPSSGKDSSKDSEGPSAALIASSLSFYIARYGILTNFLNFASALLSQDQQLVSKYSAVELQDTALFDISDLVKNEFDETWILQKTSVFQLGARVFFRTVVRLPAMVRSWWNDQCSRSTRSWAAKYFEDHITPSVLAAELELIQKASESTTVAGSTWNDDEMTVRGSRVSREITTTYIKDECALEMVVRVPSSYPLRCVEVECTKRIGISEDRWRRWVLQIIRVTSYRDGSLLDAVLLWKHNVDQEFDGVEPCPICYSILNPKNMSLPSLPCKTCNNKYHNSCLYKWFNQSGKNKCPICQQPFR